MASIITRIFLFKSYDVLLYFSHLGVVGCLYHWLEPTLYRQTIITLKGREIDFHSINSQYGLAALAGKSFPGQLVGRASAKSCESTCGGGSISIPTTNPYFPTRAIPFSTLPLFENPVRSYTFSSPSFPLSLSLCLCHDVPQAWLHQRKRADDQREREGTIGMKVKDLRVKSGLNFCNRELTRVHYSLF